MTDSNDLYFRCIVYNGCAGGGYVCVVRTTTGLVKYHIHYKSISKNNCHNDIPYFEGKRIFKYNWWNNFLPTQFNVNNTILLHEKSCNKVINIEKRVFIFFLNSSIIIICVRLTGELGVGFVLRGRGAYAWGS